MQIFVNGVNETNTYEKSVFKTNPKFIDNLRIFSEVGILFNKSKIRGKKDNGGETCVFVGYSKNHGSEVYRIYKPGTKKVVHSRNMRWMGIIYGRNFR